MHVMNEMRNRVHVELKILAFFGASSLEVLPFILCIHWETQTQKWSWRNHSLFIDFPSLFFVFEKEEMSGHLLFLVASPWFFFFQAKLMSELVAYRACEESQVPAWLGSDDYSLREVWPHATSSHGYQCVLVRSARKLWAYTQDLRLLQGCYEIETTEKPGDKRHVEFVHLNVVN